MYILKKEYKGHTISTGGYSIALNNVLSSQVETLGLEDYFLKESKKVVKTEVKSKDK